MSFKNFLISITKSLIVLFLATLIFSTITLDFPNLLKGVFGDIFSYASPDAQKQVVNKLAETCSSLDQGEFQNKKSLLHDLSSIGTLCKDYKAGKINDKEFFFNVISSPVSNEQTQMPKIEVLDKYNRAVNYLSNNKLIYFIILSVLTAILYLLIADIKLFLLMLTKISFSIGILIIIPYLAIIAYDKFVGIDTTPLLGSMFGEGNIFDAKAIISVILLLFLRTYNSFILTLGSIFLAVGIAGKLFKIFSKEETKPIKQPKGKKIMKRKKK